MKRSDIIEGQSYAVQLTGAVKANTYLPNIHPFNIQQARVVKVYDKTPVEAGGTLLSEKNRIVEIQVTGVFNHETREWVMPATSVDENRHFIAVRRVLAPWDEYEAAVEEAALLRAHRELTIAENTRINTERAEHLNALQVKLGITGRTWPEGEIAARYGYRVDQGGELTTSAVYALGLAELLERIDALETAILRIEASDGGVGYGKLAALQEAVALVEANRAQEKAGL